MPISRTNYAITTDAAGAGTATALIRGEVLFVRMSHQGTAITAVGGTTNFTITDAFTNGTIIAISNVNAPFEYSPTRVLHTNTGGTAVYTGSTPVYTEGVPVSGTVSVVVASGQPSKSGTVYLFSRI